MAECLSIHVTAATRSSTVQDVRLQAAADHLDLGQLRQD